MSYVKYREDDIKINESRLHMQQGGLFKNTVVPKRYFECKYCHQIFTSKVALINHIREIHNIVRPLIVINDRVVGDYAVLQYVNSARVLMYGFEGNIRVGSEVLKYGDEEEIDITLLLQRVLFSDGRCEIVVNEISIMIEYHPISIDDNAIIKEAITDWQKSVSVGLLLNTSYLAQLNGGDLLFAQGVYNYYLACMAKHHKSKRYDDAFAALSQFQDLGGLGKCIIKAIAFRRNWFDTLRLLSDGEEDIFTTVCEFYNKQPSSFAYEEDENTNHLFVEEGTQKSLELIVLFQKKKYSELKSKLLEMGDQDYWEDPNMAEQINLIRARLAVVEHEHSKAMRYYERLITPAFREEYRQLQKI